jgi:TRAP-type C4-dicarboxylate transport system permease small subunit
LLGSLRADDNLMQPAAETPPLARLARPLARIHDAVTEIGFRLALLVLAVIVVCYSYEVVARYLFSAPTTWASPFVSYGLCASIFLTMPELTRRSAHISLNLIDGMLHPNSARILHRIIRLGAALTCFMAAWITFEATWSDYDFGILTNTYFQVPKWWVSTFIPYGMASSGLYFLRQVFGHVSTPVGQGLTA